MNTTIESLKELYVKLGGSLEDVENITTIPEMIDAISEVAGGDEPSYEVVAEIPVGEMVENHGLYVFQPSDSIPLARNETLFFNSEEYPLQYAEEVTTYYYNLDLSTGTPTGTPAYAVNIDGDFITALYSDTPDLSNTTVRILKAAEEPSGGGKMVVHLTETKVEGETVYTADKTVAEILAADAAGQVVVCENYDGLQAYLIRADNESEFKACAFSVLTPADSTEIDACVISAEFEDGEDSWRVEEVEYVQVPTFDTTEDLGKVLTVTADGLAWVTPT